VPDALRILCINQFLFPDSYAGVERVAHETMRRLVARGHRVDMVGLRTKEGTPDVESVNGITVHRFGDARKGRRFGGRTADALLGPRPLLSRLLEETRYDLVLPHHYFPYYAYIGVARRKTAPEVMTFHASFWQELKLEGADRAIGKPLETLLFGGLARRTEKTCLRRADRVVVLSDFSREQLLSHYAFAGDKVQKIPGGVDLERFRPAEDRAAVRRALGLPERYPILLTARRLVPRMGLENLIEAVAQVRSAFPDLLLVIAGRGRLEADLRSLAAARGISDVVSFVGFVDDETLVRHYQAADLFVLPSIAFEGFGMVTLEALACGTPSVGTPIGATPEILKPLAPQLVMDGPEPVAIRRGLTSVLEWLSDAAAAERLRRQCREYVAARYGWDRAVDALEDLFGRLVHVRTG
jgi:glycosyltransferase involved in cell wall biosynthesis